MKQHEIINRRTGRTTRMLDAAIVYVQAARPGTTAIVYAAHIKLARDLCKITTDLLDRAGIDYAIRSEYPQIDFCESHLFFATLRRGDYEMPTPKIPGRFYDHFTIENYYKSIFDAMHLYDLPMTQAEIDEQLAKSKAKMKKYYQSQK